MKRLTLAHEFVKYIPPDLQEGTIYISIDFATAVHKCCCGCGNEVVTPLSPTDWKLIFDGESISLHPSIGNWSFPCQSHYWIQESSVDWDRGWSKEEIDAGRAFGSLAKQQYFGAKKTPGAHGITTTVEDDLENGPRKSLWQKLRDWLS